MDNNLSFPPFENVLVFTLSLFLREIGEIQTELGAYDFLLSTLAKRFFLAPSAPDKK